jgi:hypothetical protein
MDCRYLENLYELYVLGALPSDEDSLVQEHLKSGCAACQNGVRQSVVTVYALLHTCRPIKSTPKQKAHLLQRLKDVR